MFVEESVLLFPKAEDSELLKECSSSVLICSFGPSFSILADIFFGMINVVEVFTKN